MKQSSLPSEFLMVHANLYMIFTFVVSKPIKTLAGLLKSVTTYYLSIIQVSYALALLPVTGRLLASRCI